MVNRTDPFPSARIPCLSCRLVSDEEKKFYFIDPMLIPGTVQQNIFQPKSNSSTNAKTSSSYFACLGATKRYYFGAKNFTRSDWVCWTIDSWWVEALFSCLWLNTSVGLKHRYRKSLNRLPKVCFVPATSAVLLAFFSSFFAAAINSTNEAKKAAGMHR